MKQNRSDAKQRNGEWKLVGSVSLVVAAPCLLPALFHLAHGNWDLALLFAIPSLCCCLFYLGTLRIYGTGNAYEMGFAAFIVSVNCALWTPLVVRLFERHLTGK